MKNTIKLTKKSDAVVHEAEGYKLSVKVYEEDDKKEKKVIIQPKKKP